MKKIIITTLALIVCHLLIAQNSLQDNIKKMMGTWTVEGVVLTTELEPLKGQLALQEEAYNNAYKGYNWVFGTDGTITITLKDPSNNKENTGQGEWQIQGDKLYMEINQTLGEYTIKFEDGQMYLINTSPLNTTYYVFIKK
jgi:hypothetical protein